MKTLKTTLVLFILLFSCKGHTQDYGKEDMKINDYLVKTVGYSKELSDSVEPYQQAPAGARVFSRAFENI